MNILIVEDDTAIREGVAEFLKENEYDIVLAVGVLENAENLSFTISNIEKAKRYIWHC